MGGNVRRSRNGDETTPKKGQVIVRVEVKGNPHPMSVPVSAVFYSQEMAVCHYREGLTPDYSEIEVGKTSMNRIMEYGFFLFTDDGEIMTFVKEYVYQKPIDNR